MSPHGVGTPEDKGPPPGVKEFEKIKTVICVCETIQRLTKDITELKTSDKSLNSDLPFTQQATNQILNMIWALPSKSLPSVSHHIYLYHRILVDLHERQQESTHINFAKDFHEPINNIVEGLKKEIFALSSSPQSSSTQNDSLTGLNSMGIFNHSQQVTMSNVSFQMTQNTIDPKPSQEQSVSRLSTD
ncbi:hypothetical protein CPB83DRAFT_691315 [Crepidotus variabilis]|uniref:Uncharacterized protein n=1 Tax=Crepidotus variabilis TaxID=179855 RepID=A0A9P6E6U2_9AGAR|nr:hypothetical protein CPB83DRAFT_691315 [Crepidotus variabilis]